MDRLEEREGERKREREKDIVVILYFFGVWTHGMWKTKREKEGRKEETMGKRKRSLFWELFLRLNGSLHWMIYTLFLQQIVATPSKALIVFLCYKSISGPRCLESHSPKQCSFLHCCNCLGYLFQSNQCLPIFASSILFWDCFVCQPLLLYMDPF